MKKNMFENRNMQILAIFLEIFGKCGYFKGKVRFPFVNIHAEKNHQTFSKTRFLHDEKIFLLRIFFKPQEHTLIFPTQLTRASESAWGGIATSICLISAELIYQILDFVNIKEKYYHWMLLTQHFVRQLTDRWQHTWSHGLLMCSPHG